MQWLEDADNRFSNLEQLMSYSRSLEWQSFDQPAFSAGFVSTPHWFRFQLEPVGEDAGVGRYLQIPEPLLNELDIYVLHNGDLTAHFALGSDKPFRERPIAHRDFVIPLELHEQAVTTVYARVRTGGSLQFEPTLWQPDAFTEASRLKSLISGLFYGIMLAMLIYNFFVFLVVRDRVYFYYICVVAAIVAFMSSLQGDAYQFLWPDSPRWGETSVAFFVAFLSLPTLAFTSSFLKLSRDKRWAYRVIQGLFVLACLAVVTSLTLEYQQAIRISAVQGLIVMPTILSIGILMWLQGYRHARYFVLAWVVLLTGTSALALSKWGLLPWNFFTANGSQIGAVGEVLLLSFALADRIRQERVKRFAAQEQALAAMTDAQIAQKELLETREKANRELESRVSERTHELEEALTELEAMNSYLEDVSNTDQLTQLKNRHYFVHRYHEEYRRAHRQQQPISVILMDIDRFKDYNDIHGHLAGDACLRAVAETFRQIVCRSGDTVARYGGEEFIVLLTDTPLEGALTLAERLRQGIAETDVVIGEKHLPVTISLGVATEIPQHINEPEALIQHADKALYAAKEQGRNRVCEWPGDV